MKITYNKHERTLVLDGSEGNDSLQDIKKRYSDCLDDKIMITFQNFTIEWKNGIPSMSINSDFDATKHTLGDVVRLVHILQIKEL